MVQKKMEGINRRRLLKGAGASASALTAGSAASVSANTGKITELLENDGVERLLATAGDPEIKDTDIREYRYRDEDSLIITTLNTEVGDLVHSEFDKQEADRLTGSYFRLYNQPKGKKGKIPSRFQRIPSESELTLVHEDGVVHTRRTVTDEEFSLLREIIPVENQEIISIYDGNDNSFHVRSENGDRFELKVEDDLIEDSLIQQSGVSILRSGNYTLDIKSKREEVSAKESCWGLFDPCSSCVVSITGCSACAASCAATAGATCVACAVSACGYGGGICGCCLACLDSLDHDQGPCY